MYLYYYIFLFKVDIIILCRRLSESIMSIVSQDYCRLQVQQNMFHYEDILIENE